PPVWVRLPIFYCSLPPSLSLSLSPPLLRHLSFFSLCLLLPFSPDRKSVVSSALSSCLGPPPHFLLFSPSLALSLSLSTPPPASLLLFPLSPSAILSRSEERRVFRSLLLSGSASPFFTVLSLPRSLSLSLHPSSGISPSFPFVSFCHSLQIGRASCLPLSPPVWVRLPIFYCSLPPSLSLSLSPPLLRHLSFFSLCLLLPFS